MTAAAISQATECPAPPGRNLPELYQIAVRSKL